MATRLFSRDISVVFTKNINYVESSILGETEDYILNVNEEEYLAHLTQSVQLEVPILDWDNVSADSYEKELTEYSDFGRNRDEQIRVKRQIFRYYIPVSGNNSLLSYHQSNVFFLSGFSDEANFSDGCMILEFTLRGNDVNKVREAYESTKHKIISRCNGLVENINEFNRAIQDHVRKKFNERKERILHQKNQLAALGVPIRKANASNTFNVPKPTLRKKIEVKPVVTEKGFTPEPTLQDNDYQLILKYIDDVGKNFERLPSLYKGKREEHLRDHILMVLDPNFEMGSATGETFNKSGKTDIILNHNGQVVFIAECKYWTGEKGFTETIDQLLSYLTWRNSKASVVMFVKEKDFTSIIQKAVETTKKHTNYLGEIGQSNESWFNFRLHLNGDSNRELKLAVQLYHLPK